MERKPGTNVSHNQGVPSVGIRTDIYIEPATVSFENIEIEEDDCVSAVTGSFIGTDLDGVHHAGHGAGVWVGVGTVTAGKGSKVDYPDTAQLVTSFHAPPPAFAASSIFDWPIPWRFKVPTSISTGTDASKVFIIVHQIFTMNAAGDMTVTKAGAYGIAALNDPTRNL